MDKNLMSWPSKEEYKAEGMTFHRWSGWPGAWCLDCGVEDPNEICLADCNDQPSDENGFPDTGQCEIHGKPLGPCPHYMEHLHDPYEPAPRK